MSNRIPWLPGAKAPIKSHAPWLAMVLVVIVLAAMFAARTHVPEGLGEGWASVQVLSSKGRDRLEQLQHRYGFVPDFSLIERSGSKLDLAKLRGKIWIADFIYTTCPDTCPLQTAEMARLQEEWKGVPNLELVSFSVDPERDTPRALSLYAKRFHADPKRWLFASGTEEQTRRVVEDGFRLAVASLPNGTTAGIIVHSPRFVLVDRQSRIRGYYDSQDPSALRRLRRDVATLLRDGAEPRDLF